MNGLCALILAAGKGTRMVSDRAKVLHAVCGKPMLSMVFAAAEELKPEKILVVVGQDADRVRAVLKGAPAHFILQEKQLGTGHAVISAMEELSGLQGEVLVLSGDTPRIRAATLRKLVEHHRASGAVTTLLTTRPPDPYGYGRIIRGDGERVTAIVEEKDATAEQKRIGEINAAFYCFQIPSLIEALGKLSSDNAQKEYYLTDVVEIQNREGKLVEAVLHEDHEELQGINNRRELSKLSAEIWRDHNLALMAAGVTIIDPDQTRVDPGVRIEKDVVLHPGIRIEGSSHISEGSIIRSGVRITNSRIGPGAEILENCIIEDSEIGRETRVGPSAHLRDNAVIGSNCYIGNFVEIKNSAVGNGTTACHFSYIGDAIIGERVKMGAGAVTCNFDGISKNVTIVEDGAFIGTNSQLIAPVRIGRRAFVAAGSCITEDVPPEALAVGRGRQVNKPGWRRERFGEDQSE